LFTKVVLEEPKYNTDRFVLQEWVDFTWRVSDSEELVGVTHRRFWFWL